MIAIVATLFQYQFSSQAVKNIGKLIRKKNMMAVAITGSIIHWGLLV